MNKLHFIIFIFLYIFSFSNCQGKEKMGFAMREQKNLDVANKIIQCIEEKNVDGLYMLFSKEVISSQKNLKTDILRLYNFCSGNILEYEKIAMGIDTRIEGKSNSSEFHTSYKIHIDDTDFIMEYIFIVRDSFDDKDEGIKSLKIIKEIDEDKYFCYWQDMKPGIFIPE